MFLLHALKISHAPTPREGPFHVMFVIKINNIGEPKELNMCEFESQDATKITSALADSRINFSWTTMSLSERTIVFVLGSYDHYSVFHLFLTAL